ncbi:hypothetical protein LAZ67_X004411 [Cordylochernes scorpioides]|uniref:RNA-directed DNA polymerase n=1 Tax=Cordylochernes scorpioides TaxID=51811 RepID=A0ABY6LX49_9ARAC|nr:hypothetical protein LAZ67_X004411 [Cordylochernes scorpioides]
METENKTSDTSEICKVSVKIPPFWVEKPEIWFFQVEAQFKIGGIIQEDTKFNYLISQLEPKYIENIWDIINSKSDNKYSECKSRLLELFRESEGLRIKKLISGIELGDMKPSQLLQKLRSLATPDISDNLIKTLWLDKLPTSIKNILIVSEVDISKLAIMADKINEINSSKEIYDTEVPSSSTDRLIAKLEDLERQVSELRLDRSRSRSKNRTQSRPRSNSQRSFDPKGKYCYYHFRFGSNCLQNKCRSPCSWKESGKLQPADRVATSSSAGIQDCRNLRLFVTDKNTGLRFLVDSGADISIIPPKDKNRMPSSDYKLYAANGTKIVTYGTKVRNLDIDFDVNFNGLLPPSDFVEAKHSVKHYIPTRGQPIHSKARRLDSQRLTLAKAEFQYMLNNGIIRPSNSPWASPLHLVSKKDESLRPCGDYRRLNAVTLPDRYPIPRLDDFHHILKDTRVYSKIDLCKAFYQIPIAEEDKPKTAIITPFGLFEFNVMSFGLRNATATFQRFMHEVLRNLDFAFVYLDDILEIDFLGYLITSHGVKPLPTKVKAILEYKKPKTVHELRIFLGMLNFYRTFLNNAAETQAILHEYLRGAKKKDRSEMKWTKEAEVQFEKCKQALANTALLAYPDTELPISLCTDASDRAVGSVLQQLDNNNWKPIAFFSKKLNPAQCTDNIVADALSRVDAITTIDYEEIAKEQTGDSELQNLISKNISLKFKQCPLQSGNLLWCDVSTNNIRPFIPIKFRMMVFRNFHELSHPGIKATTKQLTSRFIWPNMNKDIRKWAQACVTCQKCKVSIHTKSEIGKYQEVDERFSVVHIDLIGALPPSNGNIYCLTCIDRYTSWMEVVPLPDMKSETVARAFYENWIVRFGAPHTVISDRGKQFTSQLFKYLTTLCGIKLRHSTAYHPQCNGKIERLHRTIKTAIRAHNSIKWTETLPTVLLGLRAVLSTRITTILCLRCYMAKPSDCLANSLMILNITCMRKNLTDRVKKPLEPPYEGPFPVLERTDKYFTLKVKGENVTTSIDRLRPAYLLADSDNITAEHPTATRPIVSGALPSTSSQQNPDPPDVEKYTEFQGTGSAPDLPRTRSGRIINNQETPYRDAAPHRHKSPGRPLRQEGTAEESRERTRYQDFEIFVKCLRFAFVANNTSLSKQVPVLLAVIGPKLFKLAEDLVAPERLETKSFDEIVALLNRHLAPTPRVIPARYKFFKSNQEDETISQFMATLRGLAEPCKFGSMLNEMLRDKLVVGVGSEDLQKRLLQEGDDATLDKIYEIALSYEAAERDLLSMKKVDYADVHDVKKLNSASEANKSLPLILTEPNRPVLLGTIWIKCLPAKFLKFLDINLVQETCSSLVNKFAEVFSTSNVGVIKDHKAHLILRKDANPRFFRARNVPHVMRNAIEKELENLEAQGVITKIERSDWAAPIVPIMKENGHVRICGYFKITLNPVLKIDQYPLPKIEDIFAILGRGINFSKIDLSQAYLQLELDENSKEMAVINTHKGLYRYNRFPFGIASAPAIWQQIIEQILSGIPGTLVYLDDILITGESEADHLRNLEAVLNRLNEYGLKANREKCNFFQESLEYCGHVIDKMGLHKTNDKIKAVLDAPEPLNVTQLRAFLGLITYYHKFIRNAADVLSPIYALLKKGTKWHWSTECRKAFRQIKEIISSDQILITYDPKLPIRLSCDSSSYGLCAVLSQIDVDGNERPIYFISRTLSQAERKYSQIDKECLSIIWALKKFNNYLFGRKFELITDNKSLHHILNPKREISSNMSARLQRWALILSSYNFTIECRKTGDHGNANGLSRLPLKQYEEMEEDAVNTVHMIKQCEEMPLTLSHIMRESCKDSILKIVYHNTLYGWKDKPSNTDLLSFYLRREELTVEQGILLLGTRVVIPWKFRAKIKTELHQGHLGVKMKALAQNFIWWPGIDREIEEITRVCRDCNINNHTLKQESVHRWESSPTPWYRVHLDFAGPFMKKMFLIVIDSYSKWPEVIIMNSTTTGNTIRVLRDLFSHYGIPDQVVTDNSPQLVSEEMKYFIKSNGVYHLRSAPYFPATNCLAERFVQTLKRSLKNMRNELNKSLANFRFTL